MTGYSEAQLQAMVQVVSEELGATANESLMQAAFRVSRQNIASPRALEAARLILGSTSRPAAEQWEAIRQACQLIMAAP